MLVFGIGSVEFFALGSYILILFGAFSGMNFAESGALFAEARMISAREFGTGADIDSR